MSDLPQSELDQLANNIKNWGKELGFQQVGISDINLEQHKEALSHWLEKGYHGEMQFMGAHGEKRYKPDQLVPGTLRIISVRMDYLPPDAKFAKSLRKTNSAYISRYAHGRDYHKLMRNRLKKLGEKIQAYFSNTQFRPFVDSAPVLEHAIAEKAGIGWTGKHTLTLNQEAGSWFFLGELFINLPLPTDTPVEEKCGSCVACLKICPTQAIVAPYTVDARRCISYLTIENSGSIPVEFRRAMGNRIYGCDDCQLICPWNRFGQITQEPDFHTRESLQSPSLLTLFNWTETQFLKYTEGSAIRRIGYERWQRNIAIALGNADFDNAILDALEVKRVNSSELVAEHILWAISEQKRKQNDQRIPIQQERQILRLVRSVEKGLPRDA
ncbi:tRNA epoxyqueuosine(34) reductase QueG [Alteromonas sp. a30]|uniref:tRNA epoxyqueuosine(34) reductase QueG n=1 Tax=Alteromonas sp. a30 TaxID=2730917 RepID=UPI002280ACD2|nr:tRNA epoxyqueuosine(34) reductase QueG [Alteromonas sp. a30]MCY7294735.1 tRNA epoxyqueuosine(34) reductase QueG [Alteromonas sp. a30]